MLLPSSRPASIDTHEENIVWSVAELMKAQASSGTLPLQITEQAGYFPGDTISATPIRTVDGGYRHVIRILMPVNPGFYGSNIPVWEFVGQLVS